MKDLAKVIEKLDAVEKVRVQITFKKPKPDKAKPKEKGRAGGQVSPLIRIISQTERKSKGENIERQAGQSQSPGWDRQQRIADQPGGDMISSDVFDKMTEHLGVEFRRGEKKRSIDLGRDGNRPPKNTTLFFDLKRKDSALLAKR